MGEDMDFIGNIYQTLLNNINTINRENVLNQGFENTEIQIEIFNNPEEYLIKGIFPGIQKRDVKISYKDNYLFVKVRKNQVFSNQRMGTMLVINDSREFKKTYYIPENDIEKLQVDFEEGKLTLTIPKKSFIVDNDKVIDVEFRDE